MIDIRKLPDGSDGLFYDERLIAVKWNGQFFRTAYGFHSKGIGPQVEAAIRGFGALEGERLVQGWLDNIQENGRYSYSRDYEGNGFEKYRVFDALQNKFVGLRWEFASRIRPYVDKLNRGELSLDAYTTLAR